MAGWEYPTCRLSYVLATRIAERKAKLVYDEVMEENWGSYLGSLRAHHLVGDISHSERAIYSGR